MNRLWCGWVVLVAWWFPTAEAVLAPAGENVTTLVRNCREVNIYWTYNLSYSMQTFEVGYSSDAQFFNQISVFGVTAQARVIPTIRTGFRTYSYSFLTYVFPNGTFVPVSTAGLGVPFVTCNYYYFRQQIFSATGYSQPSNYTVANNNDTVQITVAPAAPTQVQGQSSADGSCSTALSWTVGALGYGCTGSNCTVFYSTDPGMAGEISVEVGYSSTLQLSGLTGNTQYYAQVLCRNQCNTPSARSSIGTFTTPALQPPANVTARQLQAEPGTVEVAWTSVAGSRNCTVLSSSVADLSAAKSTPVQDGFASGVVIDLDFPATYYFGVQCSPICGGSPSTVRSSSVSLMVSALSNTTVVQSDHCCLDAVQRGGDSVSCNCSVVF